MRKKQINIFKNKSLSTVLTKINLGILLISSVLLFVPIFRFPGIESKSFIFILISQIITIFYLIRSGRRKSLSLVATPLLFPLITFWFAVLLSSLFGIGVNAVHLMGWGGIYLAMAGIAVLGSSLIDKKGIDILKVLSISSIVLSIGILLDIFNIGPKMVLEKYAGVEMSKDFIFTLAGTSFIAAQVFFIALIGQIANISIKQIKSKKIDILGLITVLFTTISLTILIKSLLPGQLTSLILQPIKSSYEIAIKTMQNPKDALLGIGPNFYKDIYRINKPLWMNQTQYWNIDFNNAFNTPLTMLPTVGLIATISWFVIFIKLLASLRDKKVKNLPETWMLVATFLLELVFPPNVVVLSIQAVLLAVWIAKVYSDNKVEFKGFEVSVKRKQNNDYLKLQQRLIIEFFVVTFFIINSINLYTTVLNIVSSYYAKVATDYIKNKDLVNAYYTYKKSLKLNPYYYNVRNDFPLVIIDLATVISKDKRATSEEDQKKIVQLLNEASKEINACKTIDPLDVRPSLTAVELYSKLITSAKNSKEMTIKSFLEAIQKDPTNPNLRIRLGDFYLLNNLPAQALAYYKQAKDLKPDYAIAYIKLGSLLERLNAKRDALLTYKQALKYINKDTNIYKVITERINELSNQIRSTDNSDQTQQDQISNTNNNSTDSQQTNKND